MWASTLRVDRIMYRSFVKNRRTFQDYLKIERGMTEEDAQETEELISAAIQTFGYDEALRMLEKYAQEYRDSEIQWRQIELDEEDEDQEAGIRKLLEHAVQKKQNAQDAVEHLKAYQDPTLRKFVLDITRVRDAAMRI